MIKYIVNFVIFVLLIFSIYYWIDRATFFNYDSIRGTINANTQFKSLNELSFSCKKDNKSSVLVIVEYENGKKYARCSSKLLAQTWDITQLN